MKKRFAVLVLCMVLMLSAMAFVACDKKDNIEVKVYSVSNPHTENPELENTITIKKGSTFSIKYYFSNYQKFDGTPGFVPSWGFYLDSTCRQKHNDDNVLDKDTSLYVLYSYFGAKFVKFEYEGKSISIMLTMQRKS